MAVAAYGAARGFVSGSSDPGRVAGVLLIAGALGCLYLYETGALVKLWKRTSDAVTGKTPGGIADPIGGAHTNDPGAVANAPAPSPLTQQEIQGYQQHYAPGAPDPLPPVQLPNGLPNPANPNIGAHPLTQDQYLSVPPWVWKLP